MPSGEIPEPAAQRQPGDPGGGDEAEWGGEPVQLGLAVHIAEQAAGLSPRGARCRIDPHTAHQRHVEQEPAVAHGEPGNVVPAALYRQTGARLLARELDAGDDVRRPETADHERGPAIDHAVPDGACLVVPWVAGPQERAPQAGASAAISLLLGAGAALEMVAVTEVSFPQYCEISGGARALARQPDRRTSPQSSGIGSGPVTSVASTCSATCWPSSRPATMSNR